MDKTITEFLNLKDQYDAESELMRELEENPLTEGQVNDIMTRGFDEDDVYTNSNRFTGLVEELRKRGMIVNDNPLSFSEFKKAGKCPY